MNWNVLRVVLVEYPELATLCWQGNTMTIVVKDDSLLLASLSDGKEGLPQLLRGGIQEKAIPSTGMPILVLGLKGLCYKFPRLPWIRNQGGMRVVFPF